MILGLNAALDRAASPARSFAIRCADSFFLLLCGQSQDVLVVTAPGSGAEIIPFLKTWVNLPMAIGFTILYAKVSSSSSTPQQ